MHLRATLPAEQLELRGEPPGPDCKRELANFTELQMRLMSVILPLSESRWPAGSWSSCSRPMASRAERSRRQTAPVRRAVCRVPRLVLAVHVEGTTDGTADVAAGSVAEVGLKRDQEAGASNGCGFAPMIRSHSMIAISPRRAGKAMLETMSSYCGNSKPVKLMVR